MENNKNGINVEISDYGIHTGYLNHQIIETLSKYCLPFISRGEIILTDKIKPVSPEFQEIVKTWASEKNWGVLNIINERYSSANTTFFLKSIRESSISFLILIFYTDRLEYDIFSTLNEEALKISDHLEEKFKTNNRPSNESIKFSFWQRDPDEGCSLISNYNKCPSLEEIKDNYSPKIWKQVNEIINLKDPYLHGKIILYSGEAGNGKTHLIRALARAWNEIHNIIPEVIIDPEDLYETPKYLTSLLLEGSSRISKVEPPFRLIIAEDCAQLFSTDCRNQTGFSRLLNTVDGLLGQGQKLIFVFTANEHIDTIDPAILRPGRCLQNLEIPNWSLKNAEKWFKIKKAEDKIEFLYDDISLAEMYAILNGTMHAEDDKTNLGFK